MAGTSALATAVRDPQRRQHCGAPTFSDRAATERPLVAVPLREMELSLQALTPRSVSALAPRTGGPVECPRVALGRSYRMGRWERLCMTTVVAAAVLVVGFASFGSSAPQSRDIVVQSGDTMLSIALQEMPNMDPARAAELIGVANGSTDLHIVPGMTLSIPIESTR
ncbi:MAG: hypothetical protein ABI382_05035 [Nakamurella sp.]